MMKIELKVLWYGKGKRWGEMTQEIEEMHSYPSQWEESDEDISSHGTFCWTNGMSCSDSQMSIFVTPKYCKMCRYCIKLKLWYVAACHIGVLIPSLQS